jgi:hypothetical protein
VTNHGGGRVEDVEVMVVGDVVSVLFARAFVWGDVDPHSSIVVTWAAQARPLAVRL